MPASRVPKARRSSPTAPADALIGSLLDGRYRITALIGRGGMAAVYRASDEELPREVAVKLMEPGSTDPEELGRQRNEIEMLASLNHHALVTLLDAGAEQTPAGERAFIVMELIDGPNLREVLAEGLPPQQVGHIGADLAEALHYMHARDIVHRDIKPANILLTPSDLPHRQFHAKLADLGIAKLLNSNPLTSTGLIIGTADYLSPEQASGAIAGPASDVYSLGLVLLETLTGDKAFAGTTAETLGARLVSRPAIPDSLGAAWTSLLMGMTALDPAERISALDVALAARGIGDAVDESLEGNLDRTLVFPVSTTAATEVFRNAAGSEPPVIAEPAHQHVVSAPAPSHPAAPARAAGRRTRNTVIGLIAAIVIAAGIGAGMLLTTGGTTGPEPSYPPVSGTLGTHLRQLQESVAP